MELMLSDAKGDERIDVQKILHGKSVSSSLTISLVKVGASGPSVDGQEPGHWVLHHARFVLRLGGLRQHYSILLDSRYRVRSPARMPSRRRTGEGITIWPFVETLVCMVRQSYPQNGFLRTGRAVHVSYRSVARWLAAAVLP